METYQKKKQKEKTNIQQDNIKLLFQQPVTKDTDQILKLERDKKLKEFEKIAFPNSMLLIILLIVPGLKSYKIVKRIADGGQSTVYLGEYKEKKIVLKCYHCNSPEELNSAMDEVVVHQILTEY